MSKLKAKQRNALSEAMFGLPKERKYPLNDRSHASNAKARAAQQVKKGNLTKAQEAKIDRRADRVLAGKKP